MKGKTRYRTFENEDSAFRYMVIANQAFERAGNHKDTLVLVDGPDESEWTVMHITEAIKNDFCYTWSYSHC